MKVPSIYVYLLHVSCFIGACTADYPCVCSYTDGVTVFADADANSTSLGQLNNWECKQLVAEQVAHGWMPLAYKHQVGYVEKSSRIVLQMCNGGPPVGDANNSVRLNTRILSAAVLTVVTTSSTTVPTHSKADDQDYVAFTVGETSQRHTSSSQTVTYPKQITNSNAHLQSGVFTCTARGVYKFQVYALTQRSTSLALDLYHNAEVVASLKASTRTDYADAGNAVILDLAVGDTVKEETSIGCDVATNGTQDEIYLHINPFNTETVSLVQSRAGYDVATYGTEDEIYSTFTGVLLQSYPYDKAPINAFSVAVTSSKVLSRGSIIVYDKVNVDTDAAYNVTSGIFTVPSSGDYVFHFFSLAQQNKKLWQGLYHNDVCVCAYYGKTSQQQATTGNSVILHARVGDHIQVRVVSHMPNSVYGAPAELYSTFSGYRLAPARIFGTMAAGPVTYFSAGLQQKLTFQNGKTIVFDRVFADDGPYNHYNYVNGEFTAPYNGLYEFNYHIISQRTKKVFIDLYHNLRYVDSVYSHVADGYAAAGNAAVLQMDAGDKAYLRARHHNALDGHSVGVYCTFSGALLYARGGGDIRLVGK